MAEFLSDEWFSRVDELTRAAGDLKMPSAMTDVTVNLKVEKAGGEVRMCMNRGLIQKSFLEKADVEMAMPAEYAYKILVQNDWSVGMRGYIKHKIKLSGNMKKLIPLQIYKPSQPSLELTRNIAAITEFSEFKEFKGAALPADPAHAGAKTAPRKRSEASGTAHLTGPWKVGGLEIRNRMVMAPMTPVWCNPDETPSDRQVAYWAERARMGIGLIITEVNSVDSRHRYQPLSSGLHSDSQIAAHRKLTDAVHRHGARIFPQISHPGPESLAPFFESTPAVGPSVNRSESTSQVCRELADEELPALVEMYAEAARRARDSGYDGVEVHMAHNYMLLGSFLSPLRNKREYGLYQGHTVEGRIRLCVEVIRRIKEKAGPDFPVGVRISGDECTGGANGRDMTDTQRIAPILEAAGVDLFHVSGGVISSLVDQIIAGANYACGFNVPAAHAVKEAVSVPVMPVGCIHDPALAEGYLRKGWCDAVVMGRPLLADPELPRKVTEGRQGEIRRCLRCLTCVDSLMKLEDVHCAVNARMGKEELYPLEGRTAKPRKIMIAGAGPGGMEAARVAALRGHNVTLYDRRPRPGGALLAAATVHPDNEYLLDYLTSQIRKLPVTLKMGVTVTPALVRKEEPEVFIDATGGRVVVPKIEGGQLPNVITGPALHHLFFAEVAAEDAGRLPFYLKAGIRIGGCLVRRMATPGNIRKIADRWMPLVGKRSIVVVGADLAAIESAEFLAQRGRQVAVIDCCEELAPEIGGKRRAEHIERMRRLGVTMHTECDVTRITEQGVYFKPRYGDSERLLPGECVLLAGTIEPRPELFEACRPLVPEAYTIGDVSGLGLIDKAIREANSVIFGLG